MTDYTKYSDKAVFAKGSKMEPDEQALLDLKAQEAADDLLHRMRHSPELRDETIRRLAKELYLKDQDNTSND